jgi:acid stress-induced BolA-like protein IbaG/YrbA
MPGQDLKCAAVTAISDRDRARIEKQTAIYDSIKTCLTKKRLSKLSMKKTLKKN